MKKILVILTGGTIGSRSENGTVNVSSEAAYNIINLYYEKYGRNTEFDAIQPVNILSENITADIWLDLCNSLDNVNCSEYSGIIICHGSDTLTYTSNLIGMLYNKLPLPIVLAASNYELDNEKSNGIINFGNAVCLIKSGVRGVFVAYGNDKDDNDIYIATRIMEADPYLDRYRSFDGKPWGRIVNGRLVVNMLPGVDELNSFKPVEIKRPENFKNKVMLIRPYPDMDYSNIKLDGVSAVVHYMYHSATVCVAGENTSAINFAKRCKELGIKFYAASFKDRNIERAYMSSREFLNENVIPLFNISAEAAYVKVLISQNSVNFDVCKTIYFESL
ncbi:MAG: asparaginase domain-containing protein [Clostridia bacterium]|nr:asparaginase domain-containing protein [Clostridia bacterium]